MSPPRPVGPAAVVALGLAIAAHLGAQEPPPKQPWHAREAPAVRYSSAAPRRLAEISRQLEATRATLLTLVGAPDHQASMSTEVLVFRSSAELLRYHREMDGTPPAGDVATGTDRRGRIVAFAADQAKRDLHEVRALLARDLLDELLDHPPVWVAAGLSAVAAELELDATGTRMTAHAPRGADGPGGEWPSPAGLVSGPIEEVEPFAAALVRYSLQPRSDRSAQFRRYIVLLRAGAPHEIAFDEAFGLAFPYYVAEARGAVQKALPLDLALPAPAPMPSLRERELSTDERNVLLGDLILRTTPWNTVAADLHFEAVPQGSSFRGAALRGSAVARLLDHRYEAAWELFESSQAAAPGDPDTCLLHSWALLEVFRQRVGTRHGWETVLPPDVARARELAALGLSASSGHPHLLHALGAADLFGGPRPADWTDSLEQAHRKLPNDVEITADLALGLAHAGATERAHEIVRRLEESASPRAAARTARLVTDADIATATSLLQRGERAQAERVLRSAREATRDDDARTQIDVLLAQLADLASARTRDQWVRRFNEAYPRAQALAAEGRLDESRALLEPFLAEGVAPEVRETAADLVDQIDEAARP